MPTFPPTPVQFPHASLGYAQRPEYSFQEPDAVEGTQPMDGVKRYRMIGPTRTFEFSLVFKWTRAQLQIWQNHYHNDLVVGQKWSKMTLALGAGDWDFIVHGISRPRYRTRGNQWAMLWDVEGLSDDPSNPLPWQIDVINAGGAYTPAIDTVLAGTASNPSSGVIDAGTAN